MEEHVGSVRPVGQISNLIDDEDVRVRVGCQRFMEISTLAGVREVLDKFGRGGEESLEAVLDGAVPDGHRQMSFPSARLAVQDQRPPLGDEVQPEVGANHGFPECQLQSEVKLVDSLEEREVCTPRAALQSRLFPSRHFFGQQQSQEVSIRPTFFFRSSGNFLVDPARVRQIEAPEVNLQLALRQARILGWVVVLLCGQRCISRIFLNLFFPHGISSWNTSER